MQNGTYVVELESIKAATRHRGEQTLTAIEIGLSMSHEELARMIPDSLACIDSVGLGVTKSVAVDCSSDGLVVSISHESMGKDLLELAGFNFRSISVRGRSKFDKDGNEIDRKVSVSVRAAVDFSERLVSRLLIVLGESCKIKIDRRQEEIDFTNRNHITLAPTGLHHAQPETATKGPVAQYS